MAVFPGAIATDSDLYVAVNNLSALLTDNPLTIGATTVNVNSTTGFPTIGTISIDAEIIRYTGITATSFTGCTRGFDGTSAASHLVGAQVDHNVVAIHHNSAKDEIIAIETHLGINGANIVHIAGIETITGTKTLSSFSGTLAANLAAGGFKLTGLAAGSTNGDSVRYEDVVRIADVQTITGAKTFQDQKLLLQETGGSDVITVTVASLATSRTYTLPDAGGAAEFVMSAGTQTITGTKTFSGITTSFSRPGNLAVDIEDSLATKRFGNDTNSPSHNWRKARGTSGTPLIVASGDELAYLSFQGHDGSTFQEAAAIIVRSDATPGAGDMPGRMQFYTTADGSATITERLRITNAGDIAMASGKKFFVDGVTAAGDTYILESASNILKVFAGGIGSGEFNTGGISSSFARSGDVVQILAYNTSNTASSDAALIAEVGGTSSGDAKVGFFIDSGQSWAIGADNSDSDRWKLSKGTTLGTNDLIVIDPTNLSVDTHGTNTNDTVTAGFVGEEIISTFNNVAVSATDTYTDGTTISLTAGDWDVFGFGTAGSSTATAVTVWITGIGTAAGNTAPGTTSQTMKTAASGTILLSPFSTVKRVSISGTTTYRLKIFATYTGTAPTFQGELRARRIR